MFKHSLLATVLILAPQLSSAEELRLPGLSPAPPQEAEPCALIEGSPESCVRTLACLGREGLWFDGQARGGGQGALFGTRSDGVSCTGIWAPAEILRTVRFRMECTDGLTAQGIYTAQDSLTGTGIAKGFDSEGRVIDAWTGNNVIAYLKREGGGVASLPCTDDAIPMS